ncbi:MAG: hypothetical protein HN337_07400 [Deltaproteobacteria bacterium]|jgi:Tfp pilus assembly protein PilN|nr:hypothetical protein [Deltaproteobacteria bacterium]
MNRELASTQRMNFLQHSRGAITYRTMLLALALWCAFLLFIYGIQYSRQLYINHELKTIKERSTQLEGQKQQHLDKIQKISKRRIGISAKEGVSTIIQNRPRWSKVLGNLTKSLPRQVWLDSIVVVKDEDGIDKLEIFGKAKTQRALTTFIMRVESGGMFNGTSLISSKSIDKDGLLNYEIVTYPTSFGL